MAITPYKPGPGVMGSKAFKVAEGFLTGGPAGAGLALVSSNNPELGAAAGAAGKLSGSDSSPMDRRMSEIQDDPSKLLDGGIDALDHPDVPQSVRDTAAPVLFAAKHYGMQGLDAPDHHFDYLYQGQENQ